MKIHKKRDLFGLYIPIYRQIAEIYEPHKIPFSYAFCIRGHCVKRDRI